MIYRVFLSVAETQFVVTPLSHTSREESMSPDVAQIAHGGPAPSIEGNIHVVQETNLLIYHLRLQ